MNSFSTLETTHTQTRTHAHSHKVDQANNDNIFNYNNSTLHTTAVATMMVASTTVTLPSSCAALMLSPTNNNYFIKQFRKNGLFASFSSNKSPQSIKYVIDLIA